LCSLITHSAPFCSAKPTRAYAACWSGGNRPYSARGRHRHTRAGDRIASVVSELRRLWNGQSNCDHSSSAPHPNGRRNSHPKCGGRSHFVSSNNSLLFCLFSLLRMLSILCREIGCGSTTCLRPPTLGVLTSRGSIYVLSDTTACQNVDRTPSRPSQVRFGHFTSLLPPPLLSAACVLPSALQARLFCSRCRWRSKPNWNCQTITTDSQVWLTSCSALLL
jgi:hypothetical protein